MVLTQNQISGLDGDRLIAPKEKGNQVGMGIFGLIGWNVAQVEIVMPIAIAGGNQSLKKGFDVLPESAFIFVDCKGRCGVLDRDQDLSLLHLGLPDLLPQWGREINNLHGLAGL